MIFFPFLRRKKMLSNNELRTLHTFFPNSSLKKYEFGSLYEVDGQNVLIKIYKPLVGFDYTLLYEHELTCLKTLEYSDAVPTLVKYGNLEDFAFISFKKEKGMDLFAWIERQIFTESAARMIARKMLEILRELERHNIVHKDIKLENVLLDVETEKLVLIDFEGKFTATSLAPECFDTETFTAKSDMWALGIMLWKLIGRQEPFKSKDQIMYKSIYFTKNMSPEFRNFLACLLMKNPEERYNVENALQHNWIQQEKYLPKINGITSKNPQKEGTHTNL